MYYKHIFLTSYNIKNAHACILSGQLHIELKKILKLNLYTHFQHVVTNLSRLSVVSDCHTLTYYIFTDKISFLPLLRGWIVDIGHAEGEKLNNTEEEVSIKIIIIIQIIARNI